MDTQMPFDTSRPPRAATSAANAYNPTYDPLVSPPGRGQDYAPTYWVATAGEPPEDPNTLSQAEKDRRTKLLYNQRARPAPEGGLVRV